MRVVRLELGWHWRNWHKIPERAETLGRTETVNGKPAWSMTDTRMMKLRRQDKVKRSCTFGTADRASFFSPDDPGIIFIPIENQRAYPNLLMNSDTSVFPFIHIKRPCRRRCPTLTSGTWGDQPNLATVYRPTMPLPVYSCT